MKPLLSLLILCALLLPFTAMGTHSMGTEVRYSYLGNNKYRVVFTYYTDCDHGDPQALAQDRPLLFTVFDNGRTYAVDSAVPFGTPITLSLNALGGCTTGHQHNCVQRSEYAATLTLSPNKAGYSIVHERCCLVPEIVNLESSNLQGFAVSIHIPPASMGVVNGSPVFNDPPPIRFNINKPFRINAGATDADGDSLAYRLVRLYQGGSSTNAKPIPVDTILTPARLSSGYSHATPLGNNGFLEINSQTGELNGFCSKAGRYMFAIACDKYRADTLLTSTTRILAYDFGNYIAYSAVITPQAGLYIFYASRDSVLMAQCSDYKVQFANGSFGSSSFVWDFGDPSGVANTSTDRNPIHTYPGPGKYKVRLIAVGAACSDTASGYVVLTDDNINPDFESDGKLCVNSALLLTDKSTATAGVIEKYGWQYNANVQLGKTVSEIFANSGTQTIIHYVKTEKGCVAGVSKDYDVYRVNASAGEDTIVLKGTAFRLHAGGGQSYLWSPKAYGMNYLDDELTPSPVLSCLGGPGIYPFIVKVTDAQGCYEHDTVVVTVADRVYVFMPNAFTPNNDGRNDVLRPVMSDGIMQLFSVYNHQGRVVFTTTNGREGWDGNYRGEPLDTEKYFWMVKVKDSDGHSFTYKGDVTLIR